MNYNVKFTFTDDDGKVLLDKVLVEVLDVSSKEHAEQKIHNAMSKKYECTGYLYLNSIEEISIDNALKNEGTVVQIKNKKRKPFLQDRLSFGDFTTTDFMNTKSFNKAIA